MLLKIIFAVLILFILSSAVLVAVNRILDGLFKYLIKRLLNGN